MSNTTERPLTVVEALQRFVHAAEQRSYPTLQGVVQDAHRALEAEQHVWLVEAEHWDVVGRHTTLHRNELSALNKAAEEVNALLEESRETFGDDVPAKVDALTWETGNAWLENTYGAAYCYVAIAKLEVQP